MGGQVCLGGGSNRPLGNFSADVGLGGWVVSVVKRQGPGKKRPKKTIKDQKRPKKTIKDTKKTQKRHRGTLPCRKKSTPRVLNTNRRFS